MAVFTTPSRRAPRSAPEPGPPWTPRWVTANFSFKDRFATGMPFTNAGITWFCSVEAKYRRLDRPRRPFIRDATREEIVQAGGDPGPGVETRTETVSETGVQSVVQPDDPPAIAPSDEPTNRPSRRRRKKA